jgi:cysteinyl-tRNA synthetase
MSENLLTEYIQDEKEIKRFKGVIKEMSDIKTKIEGYNDYIKEAKKALKEDFEIPSNVINTIFKLYHEQKAREYFATQSELQDLYETLFGIEGDENE